MKKQRGLRLPGQCRKSAVPERRCRDLPPAPRQEEKERKKRNWRHVRPELSLGNGRFGAWNAGAAERLHPAPLPHRRGLCPAAALPSLEQNNHQKKKNPTTKAKKEERERKREGLKKRKKKEKPLKKN